MAQNTEQVKEFNHDDLATAAVTPRESLLVPPSVKPVVVGTPEQIADLVEDGTIGGGKIIHCVSGKAYVLDVAALGGDIDTALAKLDSGDDSALLGYPERGPVTMAVTRLGNILTDPEIIKRQAVIKNVIWAADGELAAITNKAREVSKAIKEQRHASTNGI